jgi:hypothetical protein
MAVTVEATAITGMVEATAMATVFLGMVIITAIAIISSVITAAGNGAPTARSMSATPAIDLRRRKEARPGREARVSFFDAMMIKVIVCLGDGNQSRCKLIGLPAARLGACVPIR